MRRFWKKRNSTSHSETEYWKKRNQEVYANELMYEWKSWDNVKVLDGHAIHILNIASDGMTKFDIELHAKTCAYHLITYQPMKYRQVELPTYQTITKTWRFIQLIIIMFITYCHEDISALALVWTFITFTAISIYCRFRNDWYKEYQKKTNTLNAIVNEDYLAAYLRTPECADFIHKQYNKPDCQYKEEIKYYNTWYHNHGKEEYEKYHPHHKNG